MKKKLLITYFVLIAVTLLASEYAFWSRGYEFVQDQSTENNEMHIKLLKDMLISNNIQDKEGYIDFANQYSKNYGFRITIINADGKVLADSEKDPNTMENHLSRDEVKQALNGKIKSVERYSDTMQINCLYTAIPFNDGNIEGVLRIAVSMSDLNALNRELIKQAVMVLFFCFILISLIAVYFSKSITKPLDEITEAAEKMADGNYSVKIYTQHKSQIGRLAKSFNQMSENLQSFVYNLKNRNHELETILQSMQSAVVAVDNYENILFYNEAFQKFSNKRNELRGKLLVDVAHNTVILEVLDMVRKKEESFMEEGRLFGEEEKIIRVTGTPLMQDSMKDIGVLLIIEDITDIRKLEMIRTDFVSNVTHELKTPLTSIRGFIETLRAGAINEEKIARRFLDIIDIEAERLNNLIQDILLLSEIESKQENKWEEFDLIPIVEEVIELLLPKVKIETELIFKPSQPYVYYLCNPDRIKQLLINLIDNAIKHTEKGEIVITCKINDKNLLIQIEDTGIGIKPEDLSRIFERFYRVDKGRSKKMGGTGLGLSIVKHIVELYNGTISVESEFGFGTTFTISLPNERAK